MGRATKTARLAVLLTLLGAAAIASTERTQIRDWWRLRGYTAPPAVAALAADDTMTPAARHLFYLNRPRIVSAAALRVDCPTYEQTIVLGCYHGGENGIFAYNPHDPRLHGVLQVTAAHEMLHAAYERLGAGERKKVDAMLEQFDSTLTDPRLEATIASYRRIEPHSVVNEMHSVFGTEVAKLPPALEAYYSRYFANRRAVTNYAAGYRAQFDDRLALIHADDATLAAKRATITATRLSLAREAGTLAHGRAHLTRLRGERKLAAYNKAVPVFNAQVARYNKTAGTLDREIAAFNELTRTRNEVAAGLRSLNGALAAPLATK